MAGGCQREGERRYFESLQAQADRLGLRERVRFLGERQDVLRLMSASDLYCQGNRGPEGFGLAFLEALSAGLPIVTSALGGALELVDERCGMLVPAEDVGALAAALRALITDGALRRRMGEAARGRARGLCDPGTQLERLRQTLASQVGP
jgi:glycosyltransferase involved in cell wall biosynthesis